MRKFHAVYVSLTSDKVAYVAYCCSASSAEVKDFGTGSERDVCQAFEYGCCQLAPIRVPDPVFLAFNPV